MSRARRPALACLIAGALALTGAAPAAAGPDDVPTPTLTGPVPVTADSRTFFAEQPATLATHGYVEEEFYVTGRASTYAPTTGLATATRTATGGPTGDGRYPYKTRIVVRRPADASKFNGTTLLEWNNVTAGFDVEWNWFNDPDHLMRNGYAWVGVSAQRVGVQALKAWSPGRYGDLDVTSSAPTDQLSFDVYASVAKALRGAGLGADPLGPLETERIIASGESQSGGRLNSYYNTIQPLHRVIDAFLITVAGGTLRTDTPETKAIRVLSERESVSRATDPDAAAYRRWEVAGSSHLPYQAYVNFAPISARDTGGGVADCQLRPLSRVAWPYVANRATDALVRWLEDGTAPPAAPRHTYVNATTLERDADGIAKGAIRLPDVEVPTATNTGVNAPTLPIVNPFSAFCGLLGSWTPFSVPSLEARYADYGDYVDRVAPKAQAVADQGFVLAEDVARLKADAARFTRLRPTAPALAGDTSSPNRGSFELAWRGPAGPATRTTYEVQRRSTAAGADWEPVAGAGALDSRSLTFSDADEGTFTYRVRGRTVVPALYPDPEAVETTSWSASSEPVVSDRTPPALDVGCPALGYLGEPLGGTVTASDAGSGLAGPVEHPGAPVKPGQRTFTWTATDRVGLTTSRSCTVLVRPQAAKGANGPK